MLENNFHYWIIGYIFVISILLVGCPSNTSDELAEKLSTPPKKTLTDEQLMARYNTIRQSLGLVSVVPIPRIEQYSQKGGFYKKEYDETFACYTARITGAIDMTLGLEDGRVSKIFNNVVFEKLSSKENPEILYDPYKGTSEMEYIGKVKWQKEEALKKAEKYRQIIEENQRYDCRLVEAEFVKKGNDCGNWSFRWERYYDKYKYQQDIIWMVLNETYGLLIYVNHCISEIPPILEVRITEKQARELSLEYAKDIFSSNKGADILGASFRKWFSKFKINNVVSTELVIVNPNYLLTDKSTWGTGKRSRTARLTWVITIEASFAGKPGPKGEVLPDKKISIWIDAATGERLGGDFTL